MCIDTDMFIVTGLNCFHCCSSIVVVVSFINQFACIIVQCARYVNSENEKAIFYSFSEENNKYKDWLIKVFSDE